jgi:DNA modification methylase
MLEKIKSFYQYGKGAAYLGDSLDLMKNIPDNSINLILTSPPFALTSKKDICITLLTKNVIQNYLSIISVAQR